MESLPVGTRVEIASNAHLPIVKQGDPATVVGMGRKPGTYSVVTDSYVMRPPITVRADELRPARRLDDAPAAYRAMTATMQLLALTSGAPFTGAPTSDHTHTGK